MELKSDLIFVQHWPRFVSRALSIHFWTNSCRWHFWSKQCQARVSKRESVILAEYITIQSLDTLQNTTLQIRLNQNHWSPLSHYKKRLAILESVSSKYVWPSILTHIWSVATHHCLASCAKQPYIILKRCNPPLTSIFDKVVYPLLECCDPQLTSIFKKAVLLRLEYCNPSLTVTVHCIYKLYDEYIHSYCRTAEFQRKTLKNASFESGADQSFGRNVQGYLSIYSSGQTTKVKHQTLRNFRTFRTFVKLIRCECVADNVLL